MKEENQKSIAIPKARSVDWLIATGLVFLFTIIYWLTIGKDPTIDSYVTAHWVKSTSQINWFHPHHLLFSYACRFANLVYQSLFPPLDLLMLLTRCMHILGGLAIGLFYLRLYAHNVPRFKAASLALLVGVGYGMWFFSTIFELVMPYFAMFLAAWAAAHRWGRASRWGAFAAGMVLGGGVLIHQTLVIYLPAFMIFIFMLGEHKTRWQRALFHLVGTSVVMGAGYITAFLVLGLDFPTGWFQFFTDYAQKEVFYHGTLTDIITSARNMMSIWFYPILYADYFSFRFIAAMAFLATLLVVAVYRTIHKDALAAFCLTVFSTAFVFFTWWSPDTLDFYLIPAIVILLPLFLLIRWKYFPIIILTFAAWLFLFNNLPEMRKRTTPLFSCVMETERRLANMIKPEDKVFFADQYLDACGAYLEIPGERNLVVEKQNGSEEIARFDRYAKNAHNYAVYYDGQFEELIRKSGLLNGDAELSSLIDNAREAVHAATCSSSLTIWKIQR
jgi:hypothetical protein